MTSAPETKPHVLVVDDDRAVRESLRRSLEFNGYTVSLASDGAEALAGISQINPDAVVMDVMMPRLDGLETTRALRSVGNQVPILVLTARDAVGDRVEGLDAGADDYLTKPFEFEVLVARLEALGRRARPYVPSTLVFGSLEVDAVRLIATRHGEELPLTPREFAVLHALARADGAPLSAEDLFEQAWDERADPFTGSVRVIISRLRAKLGDPPPIETLVGRGYRLVVE